MSPIPSFSSPSNISLTSLSPLSSLCITSLSLFLSHLTPLFPPLLLPSLTSLSPPCPLSLPLSSHLFLSHLISYHISLPPIYFLSAPYPTSRSSHNYLLSSLHLGSLSSLSDLSSGLIPPIALLFPHIHYLSLSSFSVFSPHSLSHIASLSTLSSLSPLLPLSPLSSLIPPSQHPLFPLSPLSPLSLPSPISYPSHTLCL